MKYELLTCIMVNERSDFMQEYNTKSIHLLQRLTDRINCEYEDLSYSKCANYLVENYDRLHEITLQELCEKNFISKSTVRRFCRNMGYDNFSELKLSKMDNEKEPKSDAEYLLTQVNVNKSSMNNLLESMTQCKDVYLLFPNELYFAAYEFQRQMAKLNRIIYLVPNIDLHFSLIEKFLDTALIIVLDWDEQYTNSLKKYINEVKGEVIYVSTAKKEKSIPSQNIVLESADKKMPQKYLYLYFFDLFFDFYKNRER